MSTSEASIPAELVEIGESFAQRYQPVLDFHGWRVAMLRYCDHVDSGHLHRVERHRETNEVFILTAGSADLIVCEGGDQPANARIFPMRLNVAYNIGQSVWHHVLMSEDGHIILFERTNTSLENSDYSELQPDVIQALLAQRTVR